jgi:peroxiredoxin
VRVIRALRTALTTVAAAAVGIGHTLMHNETPVELMPGDPAPDFSLVGSDGRVHRLAEFAGRSAVVLAWFPKAFTGG